MKHRILLWLRAFTDKHLVREQLRVRVRLGRHTTWSGDSLTIALYCKTSDTGIHTIQPTNDVIIEFEIIPVLPV